MGLEQNRAVSFTRLDVYVSFSSSVSSFVVFENEIDADSRRRRSIASRDSRACRSRASTFLTEEIIEPLGTRRCETGNKWRRKSFFFIQFSFHLYLLKTVELFEKNCARQSKLQNLKWKEVYGKGEDTLLGIIRLSKKKCPEWPWI